MARNIQCRREKRLSGVLKEVSDLKSGDRSKDIYDAWADEYDKELNLDWGYIAPKLAVDALQTYYPDKFSKIVDLCCGTGLVGEELISRGYVMIDGLDVSGGMLEKARTKGVYRTLTKADLTCHIPLASSIYDAALCVGSMGAGHVNASHVPEMLRIVKPGGYFVIFMNGKPYVEENCEAAFHKLEISGLWTIRETRTANYMRELDRPGRLERIW